MKTGFAVTTLIGATPAQVFWFIAGPATAPDIELRRPAVGVVTHCFDDRTDGTHYTLSMDFVPTGVGGRVAAAMSAAMFERNAVAQQERVRRVIEAVEHSRVHLGLEHLIE